MIEAERANWGHKATAKRVPVRMRRSIARIDDRMAPLIGHLWRLGFTTNFCCEGEVGDDAMNQAYISFGSGVEACLFASLAGPLAWNDKTHRQRNREQASGTEHWSGAWHLEYGYATVRFPARDIHRAAAQLDKLRWRVGDLLRVLSMERLGSPSTMSGPRQSAPRTCPTCGGILLSRRKDARYCSRRCQLAARDRRQRVLGEGEG
jgi:hypothetical protein